MAISGRSGTRLWSHAVDPAFTTITPQHWNWPATIVPGRKTSTVGIVDGTTWLGLDPATGRPRSGPIDLGFEPVRPLQYADLDGDGEPEILALGPGDEPEAANARGVLDRDAVVRSGPRRSTPAMRLPFDDASSPTAWPLVVDLDGDGRSEIVVPDSGALDPGNGYRGVQDARRLVRPAAMDPADAPRDQGR